MRRVSEYLRKADEFEQRAAQATLDVLKRRYADLAECYRLLADERKRLIDDGTLKPD